MGRLGITLSCDPVANVNNSRGAIRIGERPNWFLCTVFGQFHYYDFLLVQTHNGDEVFK